jgi:hypothetical protein
MISVAELAHDPDFVQTITRLRPTTTLTKEGLAGSTYTSLDVIGSVQPPNDDDIKLLPEGVRLSDCTAFFTNDDVSAGDGASQLPDILQVGGKNYRIIHVDNFSQNGYSRFIAERYYPGVYVP